MSNLAEDDFRANGIRVNISGSNIRVGIHFYNDESDLQSLIDYLKILKLKIKKRGLWISNSFTGKDLMMNKNIFLVLAIIFIVIVVMGTGVYSWSQQNMKRQKGETLSTWMDWIECGGGI